MPVTKVQSPSGEVFDIQHPEGASQAEIIGYARAKFRDNPKAEDGTQKYKRIAEQQSFGENAAAAFGGALPAGIGLGVRQMFGKADDAEVKDWADSMSGLTSTVGGKVGALFGAGAPAVAASMVPGGQTVLGALAAGGLQGALEPVQEGQSRSGNMVGSALLNAAVPGVIAAGKTVKALTDPMRESGRRQIAGRLLERYATDPGAINRAAKTRYLSGAVPTLAEGSGDIGLSNLQRTLATQDPRGLIASRYAENNAARIGVLDRMAGTDSQRAAADALRRKVGKAAYARANGAGIDAGMADALQPQIQSLMGRSEVQSAVKAAKDLANSEGYAIDGLGSVPGLQYTKQALDDMIGALPPKEANKRRIWAQTSADLKSVLDEISPDLRRADRIYGRLSREPNRMAVAGELRDSATSALRDFGQGGQMGSPKLHADKFARILDKGAEAQVKTATGLARKPLDQIMSPDQMKLLDGLRMEAERQAAAQTTRVAGSPTAQYLAGQDMIRQIAGPLGVPKSFADSTFVENFLSRPTSWALKSSEEKLNELLLSGMLDPGQAASLLSAAKPSSRMLKAGLLAERAAPAYQGLLIGGAPLLLN